MQIAISAPFLSPVESSKNGVAEPSKHSLGLRININNQTQRGHKVQKEHAFIIVIAGMLLTSRQGVLCCRNGTKKYVERRIWWWMSQPVLGSMSHLFMKRLIGCNVQKSEWPSRCPSSPARSISRYNYYLNSLRAEDDVFTLLSMCVSDRNIYKTYG